MNTLRIYTSCQKCKRLERELEAARCAIRALRRGDSYILELALAEYDRIVAETEKERE